MYYFKYHKGVDMNSRWVKSESVLDSNDRDSSNNIQTASLPKPGGPLKPRLDAVSKKIQAQINRLEELHSANKLKDNEIFTKLMVSINENNTQHLTLLSSELASVRQVSRVLLLSCVALEKLISKLSSASDFGDLVTALSPAMAVVKNLRSSITPYVPEMEGELGSISELLSGILVDAGQVGGFTINFETANEQAVGFIGEVSVVVDQKMKEEFSKMPDLPVIPVRFS
jgi:division protein CdvB (Snf7/Vps24/ESCRT-III family)